MGTQLHILIVEDSEDDTILVVRELQRSGYEPTFEQVDTPEAMNAALEQQAWDIVLCDYAMPRFSMPAALAMVKEKGLDLPFIIVSGAIGEEAAVAAMRAGAHDYVMKDNLARLSPAIERELREAEVHRERKQAEEGLKQSEEEFRRLVEGMNDGYCVLQGSEVVFANARSAEMVGYTQEEVIGETIQELLPSEIVEELVEAHARRRRGESVPPQYEITLTRKDQTTCSVEFGARLIEYRGKPATSVVIRDITERKRMEQALRESEEHYSALVGNLTDAVFQFKEGVIAWCNDRVEEIYGYSKDELLGKSASFFYPSDISPSEFTRRVAAAIKERGFFRSISKFQRTDGNLVDIEYSLSQIPGKDPIEIIAVARDVTERRRMEEALRESEAHYRLLADNATDVIWTVDLNMRLTYISPSVTYLLGYSVEEAMGKNMEEVFTPASFKLAMKVLAEELAVENMKQKDLARSRTLEIELNRKDGSTAPVEVNCTFLRDSEGRPVEVLVIARDITERKRAEEERQRMEQQLQLAGRLAAVGELAAGVAHELNNPLAAVQAFAQFLADKDNLDETTKSDVETIYREAQRATRITTNLLRFAHRHKPEKQLVSINEILEKSVQLHAYRMKVNNIEVLVEPAPDLPMIMADYDQMHQVFVNIVTNAEQAMTEAHSKGKLRVKTQRVGGMIQIAFTDDGPGISEDNLKRLYDPFFTTKDVGKGTGLGLSICYGIVEEHGGHMSARSKPGEGTTFVVELPIDSDDQPVAEQAGSIEG
jgi:PAS domain S-box-containing protein